MRPKDALSPRDRLEPDSLKVLYISSPNERRSSWSVAEMVWDGLPRVGIRWNGDIEDDEDKGNPLSRGQGTWFILPSEIGRPIADLILAFRKKPDLS